MPQSCPRRESRSPGISPSIKPDLTPPQIEGIRLSQKVVGEMLWVLTRARPDLMYGVARMGSAVLKSTQAVLQAGDQMRAYLWSTRNEGLVYEEDETSPPALHVYTDASYAPHSEESHGCLIVMIGSAPVFWRSGRQTTVTLSTAEAELNEMIEGMTAGESIGVIMDELFSSVPRMLWTDSQSGLTILSTDSGSWRTRHLRLRASFACQTIQQAWWNVGHVQGEDMVADIGTKALTAPRLEDLKRKLRMGEPQVTKEKEMEEVKSTLTKERRDDEGTLENQGPKEMKMNEVTKIAAVIRLITMAATMTTVKGDENDEEDTGMWHVKLALMIYTVLVILITTLLWMCLKEGVPQRDRRSSSERVRPVGSPPWTPPKRGMRMRSRNEDESDEYVPEVPRPAGLPTPTQSPVPFVSAHLFLHSPTLKHRSCFRSLCCQVEPRQFQ